MNITDAFFRRCHLEPSSPALLEDGHVFSYKRLHDRVGAAMSAMRRAGVQRGRHVALDLNLSEPAIVVMLALLRMGAPFSFLHSTWTLKEKQALTSRHEVAFVINSNTGTWRARDAALPPFFELALSDLLSDESAESPGNVDVVHSCREASHDVAVINTTSGTTGVKKSVAFTHLELAARTWMDQKLWLPESRRLYVSLSLDTASAQCAILRSLSLGNTVIINTGHDAKDFIDTIRRDLPTRVLTNTGTIPVLMDYAERAPEAARLAELSAARITVTGSELPYSQLLWIMKHLSPYCEVLLGSTEAAQVGFADGQTMVDDPTISSLLSPWVSMEAVGEGGEVLEPGQSGLLRIQSPLMARGYYCDPEATAQTFRDGWFYPGDIGSVDAAGRVRLQGRSKHIINMGGNKINPDLIDKLINSQPHVRESATVSFTHGSTSQALLGTVVVPLNGVDKDQLAADLRNACAVELGAHYVPAMVFFSGALPRNAAGKIIREELQRSIERMFGAENQ